MSLSNLFQHFKRSGTFSGMFAVFVNKLRHVHDAGVLTLHLSAWWGNNMIAHCMYSCMDYIRNNRVVSIIMCAFNQRVSDSESSFSVDSWIKITATTTVFFFFLSPHWCITFIPSWEIQLNNLLTCQLLVRFIIYRYMTCIHPYISALYTEIFQSFQYVSFERTERRCDWHRDELWCCLRFWRVHRDGCGAAKRLQRNQIT